MKKLTATFCLLMAAVVLMAQVVYHGNFMGGLVNASTANLTNSTLYATTTANGPVQVNSTVIATGAITTTGGAFTGSGGGLSANSVPESSLDYATFGTVLGSFGSGQISAGFLTDGMLPSNALTNGQYGTVNLHGNAPVSQNGNSTLIMGGTNDAIVWSNSLYGVSAFLTNHNNPAVLTINSAGQVTIEGDNGVVLTSGDQVAVTSVAFEAQAGLSSSFRNGQAPTSINVTASPFVFQNPSSVLNLTVYVAGGTVTNIAINGEFLTTATLSMSGIETVNLQPGETMTVGYVSTPVMWYKYF